MSEGGLDKPSMDTKVFSESCTPPKTSQSDQVYVENSLSELNSQTDGFTNPKLTGFKRRNVHFRKGFSKNVPYINRRRSARKRVSEHLTHGLCMCCKSPLCIGNAPHQESGGSVVGKNGQEQLAKDIIEGRTEEEVSAVDEISLTKDRITDDLSEETLTARDEKAPSKYVEAGLFRIEISIKFYESHESEDRGSTGNSERGMSTITKGTSETEDTNEAATPDTISSSPNSEGSTEKDGSTVELSVIERSEDVVVEKAEELEVKSDEDHPNEIERQNILVAVMIFFWTSVRDFFVDSKYFLSKCTLPDTHGIALLR